VSILKRDGGFCWRHVTASYKCEVFWKPEKGTGIFPIVFVLAGISGDLIAAMAGLFGR
jgi:hypothetical protein